MFLKKYDNNSQNDCSHIIIARCTLFLSATTSSFISVLNLIYQVLMECTVKRESIKYLIKNIIVDLCS